MKFFQQEVDSAVDALLLQQVILYPTDTVWGLGCDAESPPAVKELYKLKGRAEGKPSIVLVADLGMLRRYAAQVPEELEQAARGRHPAHYLHSAGQPGRSARPRGTRRHRGPARDQGRVLPQGGAAPRARAGVHVG
ncbi:L-threonylcarbamoyladenylate synthase [Hymenobacter humi]|uniref:L-threonylcarbamoyladenylate synthase n=1 Tax=Hymenobacter humi TaxID=1411620 RepID=A0ABW2U873_9BACT